MASRNRSCQPGSRLVRRLVIYKSSVDDLECELAENKEDKQPYDQLAAPAPPAPRAYWSNPPPPIPEFNDDPMTWGYNDVRPGWE